MRCPNCGAAEMIHACRELVYRYKRRQVVVPDVTGWYCPACGEAIPDADDAQRYQQAVRELVREVNESATAPDLRRIRRKLRLTQREAGELFGGGLNAFSRYERGETEPPVAVVKLLRLLDRHPELLDEVRR